MGQLKIKGMELVKNLETEEEVNVLRDFLLTDPKDITHSINFWKGELNNAGIEDGEKNEIEAIIKALKNHLKNQAKFTCSIYSIGSEESNETKVTEKSSKVENKEGDPSKANLHIVKDKVEESSDVKTLREKYAFFIKQINFEALRLKVTEMLKSEDTKDEAIEFTNFILGEGLYQGKKAKKWDQESIDKLLTSWEPKPTEVTHEDIMDAADPDLYKKYENFLGDNAVTLTGIKAEVKFQLNEGNTENAIELATFLLSQGEYIDSKPEKWTDAAIEKFIIDIKDDLKANPMDLTPEGSTTVDPNIDTTNGVNTEPIVKHDMKIIEFINEVGNKILNTDITEEDIKKYVFEEVKAKNIENLDMFYNVESTQEELESMYTTFFISYVSTKFQEKELMSLDVKEESIKLIKKAIEKGEKGLATVIQAVGLLYRKRGEKMNIKEVKDLVYATCEESCPEFYAEMMKTLGEKKKVEGKVTIIPIVENFETKYPVIWETVKDAKNIDDVYLMARELEKTQDFMIVSEMIIHLMSSGKISDKEGKPINWEVAQIELWINSTFINAPTVAEQAEADTTPITPEVETEIKTEVKPVVEPTVTPDPTPEVASPETTEKSTIEEPDISVTEVPPVIEEPVVTTPAEEVGSDSVISAPETTVEEPVKTEALEPVSIEVNYPAGITIAEGDEPLKELYGHKKVDFWQGVQNIISRLKAENMSQIDMKHTIADKMMELSRRDDLSQCFVRNWKREPITQIYKAVDKIATTLEIPGWVVE